MREEEEEEKNENRIFLGNKEFSKTTGVIYGNFATMQMQKKT